MMRIRIGLALFIILSCLSLENANGEIRPQKELSLINGQGFVAYLQVSKQFGHVAHCRFRFREEDKIELDMKSRNATAIQMERGELVRPFSTSVCGIRVNGLSTASADTWTLEATNELEETVSDSIQIHIKTSPKMKFDTTVIKSQGDAYIPCTKFENTRSCRISNQINGYVWDNCEAHDIARNRSSYECKTMNWGIIEESVETIHVDIKNEKGYVEELVREDEEHIVLTCNFVNELTNCRAELPHLNIQLLIMDGLYNGKYSTYDTSVTQRRCSIEIPKPLDTTDRGIWIIHHGDKTSQTGCIFYVGGDKQDLIKTRLEQNNDTKEIVAYKSDRADLAISCQAPFVLDYCYLKSPNNRIYFPDKIPFAMTRSVGVCNFKNLENLAGVWSCGTSGREYNDIFIQDFEVTVKSPFGEVVDETVDANKGDTIELLCKSGKEEPLLNCAFTNPQGFVHLVTTEDIRSSRIEYFGQGLEKGHCGIKVKGINMDDYGQWTCQFNLHSNSTVILLSIQVEKPAIGQATAIGAGIGGAIIGILVISAIGMIYFKRRHSRSHQSADDFN